MLFSILDEIAGITVQSAGSALSCAMRGPALTDVAGPSE